jgi:polysaccharide export outer membrane protein
MKIKTKLTIFGTTAMLAWGAATFAQQPPPAPGQDSRERNASSAAAQQGSQNPASATKSPSGTDNVAPSDNKPTPATSAGGAQTNRRETQSEEEAALAPYYNNFFTTYRLGPEDVISVGVFGQDRYSKAGIIIPPNGRISYPLISEGVFVNGKTTEQVQDEITKRLDEFIIDPKVTVSLDKAMSYRYSVVGDVAQPGIKPMTRRLTITEAIGEAGGILATGDKSKVTLLRRKADGSLDMRLINVGAIYKGRAHDDTYLAPGDQVIVPGNRWKNLDKLLNLMPVLSFARIFTGGW